MSRTIPKNVRRRVLGRYGGACGYCGPEGKALHVDHVVAVYHGGSDDEANLMPACRTCNLRKQTHSVESFRREIEMQPQRLERVAGFRLARRFGLVIAQTPVVFYFERVDETKEDA